MASRTIVTCDRCLKEVDEIALSLSGWFTHLLRTKKLGEYCGSCMESLQDFLKPLPQVKR